MKTIRTFENVVEAEMMRQVLENEGVRACVIDGNMGSMLSVAVGFALLPFYGTLIVHLPL